MDPQYFLHNVFMVTACHVYLMDSKIGNGKAKEFIDKSIESGRLECIEIMKGEYDTRIGNIDTHKQT